MMRFAYADPPYLGCCRLYDHCHGADGLCWDDLGTHEGLIRFLCAEYPDGWAMSATSGSLRDLLPLCPPDVRVSPWCKSFSAFKKGVRPAYAWEPVIWRGGRNPNNGHRHAPPEKGGKQNTPKDFHWIDEGTLAPITLKKGFTGAKPDSVCAWILDLLNVQPGDHVLDVYPGTGGMGRAAVARGAQSEDGYPAQPGPLAMMLPEPLNLDCARCQNFGDDGLPAGCICAQVFGPPHGAILDGYGCLCRACNTSA